MKTINLFAILMIAASFLMPSCDQNYDVPPMEIPVATLTPNTTILDLKNTFNGNLDTIGTKSDGEDYIIKGVVIGNDISGNIYKSLMVQDESAAITISINSSGLYTTYRLGQELVINCTGLYLGKYANLQQLGYPASNGKETTFMPIAAFQQAAQLNGLPDARIDTIPIDLATLPKSGDGLTYYQSQLIELKDVYFKDGGKQPFAPTTGSASRTLLDQAGNTIIVRNSNYSDFANDTLPAGNVNVVGILSYFNNAYQILLRMRSDVTEYTE